MYSEEVKVITWLSDAGDKDFGDFFDGVNEHIKISPSDRRKLVEACKTLKELCRGSGGREIRELLRQNKNCYPEDERDVVMLQGCCKHIMKLLHITGKVDDEEAIEKLTEAFEKNISDPLWGTAKNPECKKLAMRGNELFQRLIDLATFASHIWGIPFSLSQYYSEKPLDDLLKRK